MLRKIFKPPGVKIPRGIGPACIKSRWDSFGFGELRGVNRVRVLEIENQVIESVRVSRHVLLEVLVRLHRAMARILVDLLKHRHHVDLLRRPTKLVTHNMPALVLPVVLDRQITAVLVHPGMDVTRPRPERITDLVKPVDLQAHRPRPAIGRVVEPPINTSRSAEEGDPSETGDSAPMCPNPLDDAHREVRHHQYESENCRQTPWKQRHTLPRPEYHPPDIELSPDQ